MNFVIFWVSLILFSLSVFADTCCICQIGRDPQWQTGFFNKGCDMWLKEQTNCSTKEIYYFPETTNEKTILSIPQQCSRNNSTLKLGFVGHWANTNSSLWYLQKFIAPTMDYHQVDVIWDNTACSALDKADYFAWFYKYELDAYYSKNNSERERLLREWRWEDRQDEIMKKYYPQRHTPRVRPELPPEKPVQNLLFRANQVRSIGMWDRVIGTSTANFWVQFDSRTMKVTYPSCDEFENKACMSAHQAGDQGKCLDQDGTTLVTLSCCDESDRFATPDTPRTHSIWTRERTCKKN